MLGNSSYAGVAGHRIGLQAGFLALPALPDPVVRLLSVWAFRWSDPRLYAVLYTSTEI